MAETTLIEGRYNGPPGSANGGYACGVAAALVDGPAEVTLRSPPPLDTPLDVERSDAGARLLAAGQLIAEVKPATLTIDPPPAPSFAEATEAAKRFKGFSDHPYPSCFVCGPQRSPGDGLRIFPGAVEGRELAAAPFIPDASLADATGRVRPEVVWATLDCPSWFGYVSIRDFHEGLILLGRLTARIDERPRAGDRCICVGWPISRDGRKIHCGSAVYTESGELLAVARATWIVLQS